MVPLLVLYHFILHIRSFRCLALFVPPATPLLLVAKAFVLLKDLLFSCDAWWISVSISIADGTELYCRRYRSPENEFSSS